MKSIALILARGGSKGIPNKNIIDLQGQPLISYAIKAAKESEVQETWVSTDSQAIKTIALKYGAQVIDRPKYLSTDTASSEGALIHFAKAMDFDNLVFIQPTSPLLKSEDINNGLNMFHSNKQYDSIFSVYKEHWLPRWSSEYKPINWDPKNRPRRQDVEE